MKKYICLFFVVTLFFNFTGCKDDKLTDNEGSNLSAENTVSDVQRETYYNTFENFESTFTIVTKNEKNFVIKSSDDYAGNFYEIYDNTGNLLDKGFHGWRGSFDISKEHNMVILEYGFGGTGVHPKYRLYDVERGIVSRYFEGPIAVRDTLIAYFNVIDEKAILVVQDAFDINRYYKEFTGKFDKFVFMKIQEISFSEDGAKIIIKHCEPNNENNMIEEIFILN